MYSQCDPDGDQYVMFESIVDFRRITTALCYADQKVLKADGRSFMRRTTAGWHLCVQWKDGSTSWEKLSELKESHPVECTEYALSQDLMNETAFNWWVGFVLKKRERIILLVRKRNMRYLKRNENFGIAIPNNVKEELQLDKYNGNNLWADAIATQMKNVKVAFKILDDGEMAPRDHQFVKCHMIFDIKMENFRRKARLVAGGHMTTAPAAVTYAGVVLR